MSAYRPRLGAVVSAWAAIFIAPVASAQLTDLTQTPNIEQAGIHKSLEQEIGAGVGNAATPDSSTYIILRDPARAMADRAARPASAAMSSRGRTAATPRISTIRLIRNSVSQPAVIASGHGGPTRCAIAANDYSTGRLPSQ